MDDGSLSRYSSGISGLDALLGGGYISERMYLVLGRPGTGKTILGMSFLETGLRNGENVLYIHGEESREEILVNAARVGIDLADADFLDLGPDSEFFSEDRTYELVDPRDIADDRFVEDIRERIEALDPNRVLLDPISQLEALEPSKHQYRKRIISFMRFLRERGTTVVATETMEPGQHSEIESLSDGVVELERGDTGRRVAVPKHRGVETPNGTHGLEIRGEGIEVFPALVPPSDAREFDPRPLSSGVENFDTLLGGGLERGTVTILSGPTGIGKSTTAAEFLTTAADDGTNGVVYLFEENETTFTHRAASLDIPVAECRERGDLAVSVVEPLEKSPEEFAQMVRADLDEYDAEFVVIDGISGYKQALHGNTADTTQKLHALTRYLKNVNVSVMLLDEISSVTGFAKPTSENITYLADNVVFMNYIERNGQIERVVGVLKKRVGDFENTLREFEISGDGIEVGEPLSDLRGILEGVPEVVENAD
ncbi:ATPase domain-containing protein [Halobacterium litoreum]|uniref:non-specific serine/threonine protein kinase n=1 Tax=Halobacterium litoreum TaxID=2039234 RepID=A0ABD5NIH7_9EURY|nr:ATPase domain-containing protein [Halobacterium litoreum]UHH12274.1 AAA family ATPase [Halobacterium litoreum]